MECVNKNIELRSEEVQEVMGHIPSWIVRWGITLLFLVVVALLALSCLFKYPDVIVADMRLTGQHPAVAVHSRSDGRIQELLVCDKELVDEGDLLAVIENTALTDDVFFLDSLMACGGIDLECVECALLEHGTLSLGNMNNAYASYLSALHAWLNYEKNDSYNDKIVPIRRQLSPYDEYRVSMELPLSKSLELSREILMNSLREWKLRYCLVSPISGVVTFNNYWSVNQYLSYGEEAFTIVPQEGFGLIGKLRVPMAKSGRVRVGQRVIVRFDNFPDQEFGVVEGVLSNMSLVPAEGLYTADVRFPFGLRTNYGVELPIFMECHATAEIVTRESRLIERFILPVKRFASERQNKSTKFP